MSDDVLLEVDGLRVEFEGRRRLFAPAPAPVKAVNGVSFSVARGETFGVVGESGSGKSTVAKAILRLVEPTAGEIRVGRRSIGDLTGRDLVAYRKEVQAVFQDPYSSLNPSHRVGDIVGELMSRHRGLHGEARSRRVAELLDQVGLGEHLMGRHPSELSGGQRQRVAIARALSVEPEMIICDESTSALDVSVQSQVINLLEQIQDSSGLSYLFISHDLSVVRHISHRIGVMYLGYLVEHGPAERIYLEASHPYTAMLHMAEPVPDPSRQRVSARLRRAIAVEGEPPSPTNLPKGCPFVTRCALAMDVCHEEMPDEVPVDGGGGTRCHLHTSGPELGGASILPLLETRAPV